MTVCEDLWQPGPPATDEAAAGASLLINISASPYHAGKGAERERLFAERAVESGVHVAFCALVGGQDELVFDGHSFVLDPTGETIARAPSSARTCSSATSPPSAATTPTANRLQQPLAPVEAEVYAALTLGLHDYVEKNGFSSVVLGLSGGIDSALVACLAADALGPERVQRRDHALPLLLRGDPGRRPRAGRRAGRAHPRAGDRARDGRLHRTLSRPTSTVCPRT